MDKNVKIVIHTKKAQAVQPVNKPISVGNGQPILKRSLSGEELSTLALYPLTADVLMTAIIESLNRQGYNKNTQYSPEQYSAFLSGVQSDLANRFAFHLSLVKPQAGARSA